MADARNNRGRSDRAGARRIALVIISIAIPVFAFLAVLPHLSSAENPEIRAMESIEPAAQDYSRFRHSTPQHTRMPCLVCHVRTDNRAALRMPGHIPCSSCHAQQFAEGNASPICKICHTATDVKRLPPLRSFNAVFDHARHLRQTNCATCHKPAARGVALSIPSRTNAHTTCFQCHGPQSTAGGRNIGSCSTCHQPGRPVRTPQTARAFAVNFSHGEHARKNLSCSQCHTVRAGVRRGLQVSSPAAAMHFPRSGVRSCATCHNNRRAFGGNDFSDCRRCHEGSTFRF